MMRGKRRVWAGLASQGPMSLSNHERAHLESRIKGLLQLLVLGVVGPFACFGVTALILMSTDAQAAALVACFGIGFLLPLASVMMAEDARKRRKGLKRDLARGEVEAFVGQVKTIVSMDAALARLIRNHTLLPEREHEVRILPESGYLFAIDGDYRKDFLKPDVLEIASASAPLPRASDETTTPTPRAFMLNRDERGELKERSAQLWRTPLPAIAAVAYAAIGIVMWVTQGEEWLSRYKYLAIVWGVIGAASFYKLLRRYLIAIRVGRDAEAGEAFEVYGKDAAGVNRRMVILKESRLVWSVDELPAEWRSKKV